MENFDVKALMIWLQQVISNFGLKLLTAIIILLVGKFVIKHITKIVVKVMNKRHTDAAVASFVSSLVNVGMWVFVIIAALSQVGIQTTSFVAVLGAAGLAIGLALQGSLSNFAAGFLIILFRPFKVGDVVEAGGVSGVVRAISLFTTDIMSFDNRKIIVPNSQIVNGIITNITAEDTRRVDLVFSVGPVNNVDTIKDIIQKEIAKHDLILKDIEPTIKLSVINKDSMDFIVRAWSKTSDYWTVYFDLMESIKAAFDKNEVVKPFAQVKIVNSD